MTLSGCNHLYDVGAASLPPPLSKMALWVGDYLYDVGAAGLGGGGNAGGLGVLPPQAGAMDEALHLRKVHLGPRDGSVHPPLGCFWGRRCHSPSAQPSTNHELSGRQCNDLGVPGIIAGPVSVVSGVFGRGLGKRRCVMIGRD